MRSLSILLLTAIAMHYTSGAVAAADPPHVSTDYSNAIANLETALREELALHQLHGMSVALVDDQTLSIPTVLGA